MSDSISFIDQWAERLKKVEKDIWGTNHQNTKKKPLEAKPEPFKGTLYNIHKRSLPVGMDKPVIFNLTEAEADNWIRDYTKTQMINTQGSDTKVVIYFDKVKQDNKKHSVFENDKSITKKDETPVEIVITDNQENEIEVRDSSISDAAAIKWQG